MIEPYIEKAVEIDAPAATVWKILTDNTYIPQYMFGCLAETDWQPGSPLLWKGAADGKLYVKGQIVATDPPHTLSYTVIDPNNPSLADIPENYLTMTYTVKERSAGASTLELRMGDYTAVGNGEQRYKDTAGDDSWLMSMKKIAEDSAK